MSTPPPAKGTWVFDGLPPSGARRGGDPSEHVFKHDLDAFVREVIQNANDQRLDAKGPAIDFRLQELEGAELQAFLKALDFEALGTHLDAAAKARGGRLKQRLDEFITQPRLRLLRVEDRNTVGLTGHESDGESHFRALCKDVLFSHKQVEGAGGSYGLGKSVLWTFSGWSTVLFNSIPHVLPGEARPPRLIGRAELPSHGAFAGAGWFGLKTATASGVRAESIWSLRAAQAARELLLERKDLQSGTSIQILDFREPAADEEHSVNETVDHLTSAAVRWFWPAMSFEGRRLEVSAQGSPRIDPGADADLAPFVTCFHQRRVQRFALEEPGDLVVRELQFDIPAQRATPSVKAPRPATQGRVRLIVRLASPTEEGPLLNRVAMFRGAGMVVKYLDRSRFALGRPFHAVLACGLGREPDAPTEEDSAIEAFLRAAEPPGHDEWISTPALKDGWHQGYAKALSKLDERVNQALRELLAPALEHGTAGPDLLRKRFPFGALGAPGSAPSAFQISELTARLQDGAWHFSGELTPKEGSGGWEATIRLKELGDGGSVAGALAIETLRVAGKGTEVRIGDGMASVRVPSKRGLRFEGQSARRSTGSANAVLSLEVTGERP